MYHYDSIDTNWDDPNGWAQSTAPFLNSLHPVTANLIEHAIRVRGSYSYPVIQQFILRADEHIRKMLETADKHNSAEFHVQNYSAADYAKISEYVHHLVQIFSTYYDTNNKDKELNSLKCVEMSVGNLADFLSRVESAVDIKLSPLCGTEEVKQDIRNLLTQMDYAANNALHTAEGSHKKMPPEQSVKVISVSDKFENPQEFWPPPELVNVESGIRIDCPSQQSMKILVKKLSKVPGIDVSLTESGGKIELYIYPSILRTEEMLSIIEIRDCIAKLKQLLAQNNCQEFGFFTDEDNWKFSDWRILETLK